MKNELQLLNVALRNLIDEQESINGSAVYGYKYALSNCEEMQQMLVGGIVDERYNNLLYSIIRVITEAPPTQGNGFDYEIFDLVEKISKYL